MKFTNPHDHLVAFRRAANFSSTFREPPDTPLSTLTAKKRAPLIRQMANLIARLWKKKMFARNYAFHGAHEGSGYGFFLVFAGTARKIGNFPTIFIHPKGPLVKFEKNFRICLLRPTQRLREKVSLFISNPFHASAPVIRAPYRPPFCTG